MSIQQIRRHVQLPHCDVSLVSTSSWPSKANRALYDDRHLLAMCFGRIGRPAACYAEAGQLHPSYVNIGPIFFRHARRELTIRGTPHTSPTPRMAILCEIDDQRFQSLNPTSGEPDKVALHAALNIKSLRIRALFRRLFLALTDPDFGQDIVVDSILTLLITDLHRQVFSWESPHSSRSKSNGHLIKSVRDRVYDRMSNPPTTAELAELSGASERHLLRVFRDHEGVSLSTFVRNARLERATSFLSTTDLPLKEVAYRLGFRSHASFTTAFRHETGMTPASFRDQHRRAYPIHRPQAAVS